MTTSIAIIPARGGSKRIPRKNIRPFLGKPIMAYAIEAALKSHLFTEVMVSTEDEEIAALARQYGASVPFYRSAGNANDVATTVDVLLEVLEQYMAEGRSFTYACCIYPTAPFVTAELLREGHRLLLAQPYDSVFPILRHSSPIQRALQLEDGKVSMIWPENMTARSQDLRPTYYDAGQFYWFNIAAIQHHKRLWTDNSGGIVVDEMQAHDIDTLADWQMAELKYRFQQEQAGA